MTNVLFYSITIISIFLSIVLFFFFQLTEKGEKTENKILSFILLLFAVQIFYSFAVSTFAFMYFMKLHKTIFVLRQFALLSGPLIFFYFSTYTRDKILKWKNILHLIPFVGMLVFLAIHYSNKAYFIIWRTDVDFYSTIIILAHNLTYLLLSGKKLISANVPFKAFFNNIRNFSYFSWLSSILIGFIIIWIMNLNTFAPYMILKRPSWCAYTASIYALTGFIFINTIMFLLLFKPSSYYSIQKYRSTQIDDESKEKFKQMLINYIKTTKPYLDPEMTMESVAKDISVNARILSQIINESFNSNFNSYINEYRIKESMQKLSDIKNKKTVLEILYESGFNSKSVFYSEFKKRTGITPVEYRLKNLRFSSQKVTA